MREVEWPFYLNKRVIKRRVLELEKLFRTKDMRADEFHVNSTGHDVKLLRLYNTYCVLPTILCDRCFFLVSLFFFFFFRTIDTTKDPCLLVRKRMCVTEVLIIAIKCPKNIMNIMSEWCCINEAAVFIFLLDTRVYSEKKKKKKYNEIVIRYKSIKLTFLGRLSDNKKDISAMRGISLTIDQNLRKAAQGIYNKNYLFATCSPSRPNPIYSVRVPRPQP